MRILLDTNVLIAAVIARGLCSEILEYSVRYHSLISSPFIQSEFEEKLDEKFNFSKREITEASKLIFSRMEMVKSFTASAALKDRDDLEVLGTAVVGQCELLVTGDRELLALKKFHQAQIVSPRDFWKMETKTKLKTS